MATTSRVQCFRQCLKSSVYSRTAARRTVTTTSRIGIATADGEPAENHDWNTRAEFFEYARARFVSNEKHEMEQRRVKFNINRLASIAALASNANHCMQISKCADGLYNKAFLMTMDTGVEVIAKIPNPNAGNARLVVASEAATMEFVSI